MKKILISLLFCQSLWASPISSNDVKKQKNLELIKRTLTEEMKMTVDKMIAIIKGNNLTYEHINNSIKIEINGYRLIIVYDLNADRMRIISPIVKVSELKEGQLQKALDANFHTALDARYAISDDIVWSVFVHPLSDLSEKLFQSALEQTLVAAATFGKEYSSGALSFPKPLSTEEEKTEPQEKK